MAVAKTFTPELIANGQHRYEYTDEPLASIAIDFGVHVRTMREYIKQWKWRPRAERPPKGLAPLDTLMMQAQQIPATDVSPPTDIAAPAVPPADDAAHEHAASDPAPADTPARAPVAALATAPPAAGMADERSAMIERLWRAASAELAAVERMRAQIGTLPQAPVDAERTARTLESLLRIVREMDRLRGVTAVSAADDDDDDLPRDLDEFRHALARRIEAFVASRMDGDVSQPGREAERVEPDRA